MHEYITKKKIIRHILFDCDGCVSEPKQGSKFTNEYLFKKLRDENKQYDLNVLGSFSSRQSITVENLNKEENITFVFSTHDARVVKKARRVITIEDGKVISDIVK